MRFSRRRFGRLIGGAAAATLGLAVPARRIGAANAVTYCALGASDTVGVGADRPDVEGWTAVLHSRLPAGSKYLNLGVSGTLIEPALRQQAPVAVAAKPDLATIWLAVNDFNTRTPLARYRTHLNDLLSQLAPAAGRVFIGNVPDLTLIPVYEAFGVPKEALAAEIRAWNGAIAEIGGQRGAIVVDIHVHWQELADHPEYVGRDGFHPSAEGYRRLADIFWDVIAPTLADS